LILIEHEYKNPETSPKFMDKLRQSSGRRTENQKILRGEKIISGILLKKDYEQNHQNKIGLIRSDRYVEALIGAVYDTKGLDIIREFVREIHGL